MAALKQFNIRLDPRYFQLAVLSVLITYGVIWLDFAITPTIILTVFSFALVTQLLASLIVHIAFEWRSAAITSCSLILLLRSDAILLYAAAAVIAISSKFLLRMGNKHIFNPANLALVVLTLVFDGAWLSTGQWGDFAWFGLLIAGCGWFVTTRASRLDITLAFLFSYVLLLLSRAFWLGDPLSIPLHQMQNGALLIFAFFMISDPASTPSSSSGRILFAALTAMIGFTLQFIFYQPLGIIYALAVCSPLTPIIDKWLPGSAFQWRQTTVIATARPHFTPQTD